MLLPWLLETRLVSWKTAIEEAHMYALDGLHTQFTSKWTRSYIVKENSRKDSTHADIFQYYYF